MSEDNPTVPTPEMDGTVNVGDASKELQAKALFDLAKLNEELGTNYASTEKALEGLKNLKSFVGSKVETVKAKVLDAGMFITKEQYEQDMFYSRNSDLAPYKDIINARAEVLETTPEKVVESDPIIKSTLEKLRGYDDTEKAKSVLMSNSRLGQVTDALETAQTALKSGDYSTASKNAVQAVLDAYGK